LETVVSRLENEYGTTKREGTPPERVKAVRQSIIRRLEREQELPSTSIDVSRKLGCEMEDLFFAMQLYSYRGDYLVDNPSIERLAETVDKFEEDILRLDYPNVRGRRRVTIRFDTPIELPPGKSRRSAAELTEMMQSRVQSMIDEERTQSSN